MIIQVKGWQEECELRALKFAETTMTGFSDAIEGCGACLPRDEGTGKVREGDKEVLLNMFIDVVVGIAANICGSYCNDLSGKFEDKIIEEFRRKFSVMRKRAMGGEAELTRLPIKQPEDVH